MQHESKNRLSSAPYTLTAFVKCAPPFCPRFDLKRTPIGKAPWRFILTWMFVIKGRQWPLKELTVIVIGTISAFKKITFTKAHHQKIFHNIYPSSTETLCYHIQTYHVKQSFLKVCYVYFSMMPLKKALIISGPRQFILSLFDFSLIWEVLCKRIITPFKLF